MNKFLKTCFICWMPTLVKMYQMNPGNSAGTIFHRLLLSLIYTPQTHLNFGFGTHQKAATWWLVAKVTAKQISVALTIPTNSIFIHFLFNAFHLTRKYFSSSSALIPRLSSHHSKENDNDPPPNIYPWAVRVKGRQRASVHVYVWVIILQRVGVRLLVCEKSIMRNNNNIKPQAAMPFVDA